MKKLYRLSKPNRDSKAHHKVQVDSDGSAEEHLNSDNENPTTELVPFQYADLVHQDFRRGAGDE
jgi:hypothetical protein